MLDAKDVKILNALLNNSRTSTTKISESMKISNVATQQRISKLEKMGVIKGYTATLDYTMADYKTIAYLGIFLEQAKNYPSVIEQLNKVPQISEAHFTTGNYSIFAKIYARNNMHLMEILSEKIQNIQGVARTETFISLQEGINKPIFVE
ncbi:Lrp/AsnC ligand binding domain-containing protein [Saprospiraceae bacterium]|nr:Lrp/AsnC ligand binding domain-containing protein [Saprospiraceae bacterium]